MPKITVNTATFYKIFSLSFPIDLLIITDESNILESPSQISVLCSDIKTLSNLYTLHSNEAEKTYLAFIHALVTIKLPETKFLCDLPNETERSKRMENKILFQGEKYTK